jgi:hypothetical protein
MAGRVKRSAEHELGRGRSLPDAPKATRRFRVDFEIPLTYT